MPRPKRTPKRPPPTPEEVEAERLRKAERDAWWDQVRAEQAVGTWPWARRNRVEVRWSNGQGSDLYHDITRVPEFQRGSVWDEQRAIDYVTSWCRGLASSPMLAWVRSKMVDGAMEREGWILDGQQRMLALGFTLTDAAGEVRRGPVGYLDFETGEIVAEPGPMRSTIAQMTARGRAGEDESWYRKTLTWMDRRTDPKLAARASDADRIRYSLPHTFAVLGGWDDRITSRVAREYFRHWNIPGVPFEPGEIDRLISILSDEESAP